MRTAVITRYSLSEQTANQMLLSAFAQMMSGSNLHNISNILHEKGTFFGCFNYLKAAGIFHNMFFAKNGGTYTKENMRINEGISIDHLPGETVLEFRFFNHCDDMMMEKFYGKKFGDTEETDLGEFVVRLAVTVKDNKLYTIRIPQKCIEISYDIIQDN